MRYFALFLMVASLTVFGMGCAGEADKPKADPSPAADKAKDAAPDAKADKAAPAEKEKEGSAK